MTRVSTLALATALLGSGCATVYSYRFEPLGPMGDADVPAQVEVDPLGARALTLQLTNRTELPVQVQWAGVTLVEDTGRTVALRPDEDLGWVTPGATQTAHLGPFVVPREGDRALAYQGHRFELRVPLLVRREPRVLRYSFQVHLTVQKAEVH